MDIRKIILTTLLNEQFNQQNLQYININDIVVAKELILVDTKNVHDIISTAKNGKMPLDELRVLTMVNKLNNGGSLPPIKINGLNMLIDGHHRYMAYKLSNINNIPFIRI